MGCECYWKHQMKSNLHSCDFKKCSECPCEKIDSEVSAADDQLQDRQEFWMCLSCGVQLCGLQKSGHSKSHYNENGSSHALAMSTLTYYIWCHSCEEYVHPAANFRLFTLVKDVAQLSAKAQKVDKPPQIEPICEDFEGLMKDEELADFTFIVDGQNFKVHKAILAIRSPILRKMMLNEYHEVEANKTIIKGVSKEIFKDFLGFIYTGKIQNLSKHAIDLMALAQLYEVETLKKVCDAHLASELTEASAYEIFNSAHRYRFTIELKQASFKLIQASFSKTKYEMPDEFFHLPEAVQKAIDLKKALEDHLQLKAGDAVAEQ